MSRVGEADLFLGAFSIRWWALSNVKLEEEEVIGKLNSSISSGPKSTSNFQFRG